MSVDRRVLVLGGGVAGLAAACALADRGIPVTLLEKRRAPGGKAFSFRDSGAGIEIDNGQHVFLGCCTELRGWLARLGTARLAPVEAAPIPFLLPGGAAGWIGESWLPAPFHGVPSLLCYPHLAPAERWGVVRAIGRLRRADTSEMMAWDTISFSELLDRLGQSERMRRRFWDPIVVSACNVLPERASARIAALVFREALAGGREGGRLAVPRAGLSDLIARPAARYLGERGGEVRVGAPVVEIGIARGAVTGVRLADGSLVAADRVVCALAWDDLPAILPPLLAIDPFFAPAAGLTPSPIVGIHLRFESSVMELSFAGLLESPLHWVFNQESGRRLSLIVSDAREWLPLGAREVLDRTVRELARFFPAAATTRLAEGRVIKERKATFAPIPDSAGRRLPARTPVQGLYLAGAWTDTGWPATLEGAVRSGLLAAAAAQGGEWSPH